MSSELDRDGALVGTDRMTPRVVDVLDRLVTNIGST
jgi:hypothetical protein